MSRMSPEEAEAFWSLSPEERLSIVRREGFLRNDYVETLRTSDQHRRAVELERALAEREELGLPARVR